MATRAPVDRVDGQFRTGQEPAVGELLRSLSQDAATLVKQEITLAKLEVREGLQVYTANAASVALAGGLALLGAMALTAFAIAGLGDLLDSYWLGALIVAVVLLVAAAVLGKRGINRMKEASLRPDETVDTLREDKQWAQREARELKTRLKA